MTRNYFEKFLKEFSEDNTTNVKLNDTPSVLSYTELQNSEK